MTNPLLERVRIPGAKHRLPSGGIIYVNGELDELVTNGEVQIYPMTALDEIVLKNPDKLLDGRGVVEVFGRCIPDIKQPARLFAKDVDYLIMALRQVTYGDAIEIEYKHTCEHAKNHSYKFSIDQFLKTARGIDPTTVASHYKCVLPNGQTVELRPMLFQHTVDMMSAVSLNTDYDYEQMRFKAFETMATVIHKVDEVDNPEFILQWARAIPDPWIKQIMTMFETNGDWGPSSIQTVICKDCKEEMTVDIPLNPLVFFT